ncbi:hypothetical protein ACA910_022048 [Epithemia clementina (nom. ined.)]
MKNSASESVNKAHEEDHTHTHVSGIIRLWMVSSIQLQPTPKHYFMTQQAGFVAVYLRVERLRFDVFQNGLVDDG